MATPLRVLILEDRPSDAELMAAELRAAGYEPDWHRVDTRDDFAASLTPSLDLILADYHLPQFDGVRALQMLKERGLDVPFIIVSGAIGEDTAVLAMQQGAADYLLKDRLTRLGPAVKNALEQKRLRDDRRRADEALRESEKRYRRLLGATTDYIYTVKVENGQAVSTSHGQACEAVTGYTSPEYAADPHLWHRMVPAEDKPAVFEHAAAVLSGKMPPPLEHRIRHKDGSLRWVRNTVVPRRDERGRLVSYDGLVSDITERRQAEEKYRSIFEDAIEGIFQTTPEGRYLTANPSMAQMLGYDSPEELLAAVTDIGRQVYVDPGRREEFRRTLEERGMVKAFQMQACRKDRAVVWLSLYARTVRDDTGKLLFYEGSARDITERKRAEEERQKAQERFSGIYNSAKDAIGYADLQGALVDVNNAFCQLTGYTREELLDGRTYYDLTPKEYHEFESRIVAEMMSTGAPAEYEKEYIRKDGTRVPIGLTVFAVKGPSGDTVGVAGIVKDVTERQRAQKVLEDRVRLAAFNSEVSLALTQTEVLRDALQQCAEAIFRHLEVAFARIWTLNKGGTMLELQASAGMYTHLDGAHSRIPMGQQMIGRIARQRQAYHTNAVLGDPLVHDQEWARREGMVAFAGHPLIVEDRVVGVMAVFARRPLSEFDWYALASIADPIALGIQRKWTEAALKWEAEVNAALTSLATAL
ncbi:MAG: PAS domain S-box protein, partial [Planctomycetes bacterium]|nr:PAS domain S-box protein [Planctomycetota bacterium]